LLEHARKKYKASQANVELKNDKIKEWNCLQKVAPYEKRRLTDINLVNLKRKWKETL